MLGRWHERHGILGACQGRSRGCLVMPPLTAAALRAPDAWNRMSRSFEPLHASGCTEWIQLDFGVSDWLLSADESDFEVCSCVLPHFTGHPWDQAENAGSLSAPKRVLRLEVVSSQYQRGRRRSSRAGWVLVCATSPYLLSPRNCHALSLTETHRAGLQTSKVTGRLRPLFPSSLMPQEMNRLLCHAEVCVVLSQWHLSDAGDRRNPTAGIQVHLP